MDNLDYGIIGNCKSAALISKNGGIDWCCLPNFDSSSVFAKILDEEKGGSFEIIVSDDYHISQKYIDSLLDKVTIDFNNKKDDVLNNLDNQIKLLTSQIEKKLSI